MPVRPSDDQVKIVLYHADRRRPSPSLKDTSWSSVDSEAFDFFRQHILEGLTGPSGSEFWSRTVLKAAHQGSAVLKAITAVTYGFQRRLSSSGFLGPTPPTSDAVVLKYHAAIASTKADSEKSSPQIEMLLITCALFVYFEMVQMHFETALQLMSKGVYLYLDWTATRRRERLSSTLGLRPRHEELPDGLDLIFGRLASQLLLFVDSTSMDWRIVLPDYGIAEPVIPAVFGSAKEAKACLEGCENSVIHTSVVTHSQGLKAKSQELDESGHTYPSPQVQNRPLAQWLEAFRSTNFRPQDQQIVSLMEIQYRALALLESSGLEGPETKFDAFEKDFELITKSVSLYMNSMGDHGASDISALCPSFDIGIVAPLYFVATRCRQPTIRSEALQLLQRAPKQEGIWYSGLLVKSAERIISLEADQQPVKCPESSSTSSARVVLLNVTINSTDRTALATFCWQTIGPHGAIQDTHVFEETLKY